MQSGLISVILVTYNHEKYIVDALDSLASQTYRNFEVIVLNDASTDETENRIADWRKKNLDISINYVGRSRNMGLHYGLNEGLDLAKGEFIQILSGDDVLVQTKFEEQVKILNTYPDVDYAYASHFCFNDSGVITQKDMLQLRVPTGFRLPEGRILLQQLSQMLFSVLTLLVRTSFLKERSKFNFNKEIIFEDLHLFYFLGLHGLAKGSRKVLAGYRYNDNGTSITNVVLESSDAKTKYKKLSSRIKLLQTVEAEKLTKREKRMLACSFHILYLLNYPTGQDGLDDYLVKAKNKYGLSGLRLVASRQLIKIRFPYNCFLIYFLYDFRVGLFFLTRSIMNFFGKFFHRSVNRTVKLSSIK